MEINKQNFVYRVTIPSKMKDTLGSISINGLNQSGSTLIKDGDRSKVLIEMFLRSQTTVKKISYRLTLFINKLILTK